MIDYVGLNILAGIYALIIGYAVGRYLQDGHYRKLLRKSSEDYNSTIQDLHERYDLLAMENKRLHHDVGLVQNLQEHNERLELENLCMEHDIQTLENDVKHWKSKATDCTTYGTASPTDILEED